MRWPTQLGDLLIKRGYQIDEIRYIATTGWRTDDLVQAIKAKISKVKITIWYPYLLEQITNSNMPHLVNMSRISSTWILLSDMRVVILSGIRRFYS
ncbi:MAG: hypothetical protein IPP89_00510 [Saprospiraceae bacterium]|nr:hypothetical protein [Candidatus Brachybacter algidus]MBL0117491.1 hypothetical protein [Candidatus Brachybacter algidus]